MTNFHNILEQIHQRPGMFTGENTLRSICHFLSGYEYAYTRYKIANLDDELLIPGEFHSWVAYRLRFFESTSGWCNMIYARTACEKMAIDRFFELLREFHNRKPHLVAKLIGYQDTYKRVSCRDENGRLCRDKAETMKYPDSISFVTYTDDPGFFVYSDTQGELPFPAFWDCIETFEILCGIKRDQLTIIDLGWGFGESA